MPTLEDVQGKSEELFNRKLSDWGEAFIKAALVTRRFNGPPVTDTYCAETQKRHDCLRLPGYGLPLSYRIEEAERHPILLGLTKHDWNAPTLTNREVCMLKLVEDITNKPEWWLKVQNPMIVSKWKQEALQMPWTEYQPNADFTEKMAVSCFNELAAKARICQETGLIPVMDYAVCVIKSDTILTNNLMDEFKIAVTPLENVPEHCRDWHPGSDGKVLDLVHPSLWPLAYGLSRIVPDDYVSLHKCLEYCGAGVVVPLPGRPSLVYLDHYRPDLIRKETAALSTRFQWLPCDVDLTGERPRIESYINNLHPIQHANLYPLIEQFIEKSLPAWDIVCRPFDEEKEGLFQRLETIKIVDRLCSTPEICRDGYCYEGNRPLTAAEKDDSCDSNYMASREHSARLDEEWWKKTHKVILPEPKAEAGNYTFLDTSHVKSKGFFDDASRIQVIVKLANIHLTPENPTYEGGSWHVEGQLNEHICATALYYYDCENITESRLAFRTQADREDLRYNLGHGQDTHSDIEAIFAIDTKGDKKQNIGSVLTRQGRALFFPNVYQHRVEPFELADKTRPGHRKILALFLVDPLVQVISTGNVPPQQQDWWVDRISESEPLSKIPTEIRDMISEKVDFPYSLEEAKKVRQELISERKTAIDNYPSSRAIDDWNFCEH
ncbi:hypothetical protein ACHAPJ_011663 [Fusarium lateritium]